MNQILNPEKLCIDCKYFHYQSKPIIGKCVHPSSLNLNEYLVDGDARNLSYYSYASTSRIHPCGLIGKYWEPIPTTIIIEQKALSQKHLNIFTWFKSKII